MPASDPAQEPQNQPQQPSGAPLSPFVVGAAPFALSAVTPLLAASGARALTGASLRTAVEVLMEGFVELAEQRWQSGEDFTRAELTRIYPQRKPSELAKLLAQEARFEREFRRKMAKRLAVDLQEALTISDPDSRLERLKAIFDREKRYSVLREEAMFLRALGKAEAMTLREHSPQGAYWKLSAFVKQHTLDCIAMGEKFWPWEVLENFQPPVHHGCACFLLGLDEAVGEGLMDRSQVPEVSDALMRAKRAMAMAERLHESLDPEVIREHIEAPARDAGNVVGLRRPVDSALMLLEGANQTGAMVALYPPRSVAKGLALDGGEPVEDLHVTLAFLGEAKDLKNIGALTKAVEGFAASCPPISGEVSGSGKFTGGPDPVVYASVDLPGLPSQRERLVDHLKGAGAAVMNNHGFTPHLTLAYDDRDVDIKARPISFNTISLVMGGKRLDFPLKGAEIQEARDPLRYPKGFEHGGEFRPRHGGDPGRGVLKKMFPHPLSPLTSREQRRGSWSWINGTYLRIPEADGWDKRIAGHHYHSPPGSTHVYKDGKLLAPGAERRTHLRTRRPATPEAISKAADRARADLRAPRPVSPAMPPVRPGDPSSRLLGLGDSGWRLSGVVGKALRWMHPSGARLETEFDGKKVSKVDYVPDGPLGDRGVALTHPPHDFGEFASDMRAFANEIAERNGALITLGEIVPDPTLDDHAGQHLWSGKTLLGVDTAVDIDAAGAARAKGRKLSDAQKRGVWASYWNAAHEVTGHAINPISPQTFLADDGVDANLEEALAEELAHVHAVERLQETGQGDVLRWRKEHPHSPSVQGVYLKERAALGSLLDEADVTDPLDRRVFLEDLKYRVKPDDRPGVIADALIKAGRDGDRAAAIEHVREVMTSGQHYGSALAFSDVSPGKAQVGDAYGRYVGATLSKDGRTLTLADGSRRAIERLAVPAGNPRLAAVTDGTAIVAYGPNDPATPGMKYANGKPKTFRFLDSEERGKLILRALQGKGTPGTTNFGLRDVYEDGDTVDSLVKKVEGSKQWVAINTVPVKRRFDGSYGVGHAGYDGRRLSGLGSAKTAVETALLRAPDGGPRSPGVGEDESFEVGQRVRSKKFKTTAIVKDQFGSKVRVKWVGTGVEVVLPANQFEADIGEPQGKNVSDTLKKLLAHFGQGQLPLGEQEAIDDAFKQTFKPKKQFDPMVGVKLGGDPDAPEPTGPIPNYDRTSLTLSETAGGSNGARWAFDDDENRWLVKSYRGDQDRVATEVLANAVYRAVGAKVAKAGTLSMPPDKPDFRQVSDVDLDEPKLPSYKKGRNVSTGMVVIEDGKLWIIKPKGGYGGYDYTIPKGRVSHGLTGQQNAAKEVWEETGLHATPVAYIGDYEGDTGVTRMYLGVRTGGEPHPDDPTPHVKGSGKESESVHLVSFEQAADMLNRSRDQRILDDAFDAAPSIPADDLPDRFPHPKIKPGVAYPAEDGEIIRDFPPSEKLGEHYMTDALVANWDFVGMTGDNVLWDEDGNPIRLDQGGTFEQRAMGGPKPYGPIPTEVWTMLTKGQGARGVKVTDDQMRQQAAVIAKKLSPQRIDKLVDAAPFADNAMRERVRENLKARVNWMDQFGQGHIDLPKPAEGDEAHDSLWEAQKDLMLFPEQEEALFGVLGPRSNEIQGALGEDRHKRPKAAQDTIDEMDSLMRHARTAEDVIAWLPINTTKPETLVGKVVTSKTLHGTDDERPDAPVVARVVVPGGSHAVYTGLWNDMPPTAPDLLVSRNARMKVSGYHDGVLDATLKTEKPYKPYTPAPVEPKDTKPEDDKVQEAVYDPAKHLRDRRGRWHDMPHLVDDVDHVAAASTHVTDAYIADLERRFPRKPNEPIFEWQGRLCDGLPPEVKHEVLFRIRERYAPVDYIAQGAKRWRAEHGLPEPQVDPLTVRAPLAKADRVARAFETTPDESTEPKVRAAYEDFRRQSLEMYDFITKPESEGGLGIKVDFGDPTEEPYPSATAQAEDLRQNHHFKVQSGLGGHHEATMAREDYDKFRAVHDIFGHAGIGGGFDRHGEYEAWLEHMSMYSGVGQEAMASEYHGVNTAMWTGAPGTPGTGKSILLPENLIDNPWDKAGHLVREAAHEDGIDKLIKTFGLNSEFAAAYDHQCFAHPLSQTQEWLVEGRFDKAKHPRGRAGRWVDVLGGKLKANDTTIGVTPFLTDPKAAGPLSPGTKARPYDRLVPDKPITDFQTAAALHQDPRWEPLWSGFESDAEKLAKQHNVSIERGERNVGVFEGNYEPSYAITLSGDKKNIDAYNQALGAKYHQKAVVGFTADPKGRDAEIRFTGGKDPAGFFDDLKSVMGDDAGASFDSDTWRVFVYDGASDGGEVAKKLLALAGKRGMQAGFVAGHGDYFELRQGKG